MKNFFSTCARVMYLDYATEARPYVIYGGGNV